VEGKFGLPDGGPEDAQANPMTSPTSLSFTASTALSTFDWGSISVDWAAISEFFSGLAPFFPVAIAGTIVWGLWFLRFGLSHRARPIHTDYRASTSVIVPSFHEDPDILMRCLDSWRAQGPDEIIVVLDVADLEAYDRIEALGDERVRPILFHHVGKRSALGAGIREAKHDILVLTDSDTMWCNGLLRRVQMPFIDPLVGGVGTHQNVFQRETSIWRRIADWLVNLRYYDYVPAMGRAGAVPCLSGRTAAYRRSAVLPVLEHLENEFFLGRRCIAGDDGRLTWLVLASGYKTVHQSSARALSMFPTTLRAFVKQRVRWSRNSYRCYLTAVAKGWLWRMPFITKVTVLQILLTPVTMGLTLFYLIFSRLELTTFGIIAATSWLLLGRGIRGYSHLRRHPEDLVILPVLALTVILIALPIKLYAFLTMNKQGWLTRHATQIGGDGQASLARTSDTVGRAQRGPSETVDAGRAVA
jgi:N-acetylglucosaminyltransferase